MPLVLVVRVSKGKGKWGQDEEEVLSDTEESQSKIRKFYWKGEGREKFVEKCNEVTSHMRLIGIEELLKAGRVKEANSKFYELMTILCSHLEKKNQVQREVRGKGWFDSECLELKKEMRRKLRKFRKNSEGLDKYIESKNEYNKLCSEKKEKWGEKWKQELDQCINERDDRGFWRKIKHIN